MTKRVNKNDNIDYIIQTFYESKKVESLPLVLRKRLLFHQQISKKV